MVSDRSLEVLRVIVQDYVASREPVGSKSIVDRHSFGVSAATIRNDMALLEEEELITAPHTSSGRIPTDKGYRLFVDHLADLKPLTPAQRQAIETFLGESADLDDVLARTVRLLSQLTRQVAMVQYPSLQQARFRHLEVVALAPQKLLLVVITDSGHVDQRVVDVPSEVDIDFIGEIRAKLNTALSGVGVVEAAARLGEIPGMFAASRMPVVRVLVAAIGDHVAATRHDKLVIAGASNLVRTEDDFRGSILPVLEAVEEQVVLLRLFSELEADQRGVSVSIGRENAPFGLGETSILASGYSAQGGSLAHLGVLGPTRMDYSSNIAAVRAVARYLSRVLGES
ncbi:heat-inducible transcription repressor HrcA [Agreia bicolorata]|uniref:Heat-inducible transcription repressor HrcA n=1 Tax=Agreia bicolorata TaxID=110935 RepID=A0A1T4YJM6_9MICO|nr:heat-inducible transcriptional repressor HrcA [Agreia bicolorata]KJC63442.1 HrcA family transcriptional regulator [Agreia bicolorata]SKB01758.1 heat-inducible transcription repressor HrcA [Agreia bicolorata]